MSREIIHVRIDDFYASVLRIGDPALRSRPVVVGYLCRRGAVLAVSGEAAEAGVRPGMTTARARRLCPEAAFVEVDRALFRRVSGAFFGLLSRYSPLVEPAGPERGFLDYTGCSRLFGPAPDAARKLGREIGEKLSLEVSIGLGRNKLISELAARAAGGGGIVEVPAGSERSFLAPLPVEWLPGIGPARSAKLASLGVRTIGTLAEVPSAFVAKLFGPAGGSLAERARGVDERPVVGRAAGVSEEELFDEDVLRLEVLEARLYVLCERLARRLRESRLGAKALALTLVYTDGYRVERRLSLPRTTALDGEIYESGRILLERSFRRRVKARALRVEAQSVAGFLEQEDMFHPKRARSAGLYAACDRIRRKYGEGTLRMGRTLMPDVSPCD